MSEKKFRVKFSTGRIIGPISQGDYLDLFKSGQITLEDEVQVFPAGDWSKAALHPDLSAIISELNQKSEMTFIFKLSDKVQNKASSEVDNSAIEVTENKDNNFPSEFKYTNESENKESDVIKGSVENSSNNENTNSDVKPSVQEKMPEDRTSQIVEDKTVYNDSRAEDAIEKTIVTAEAAKYFEELKRKKEIEELENKRKDLEKKVAEPEIDYNNDKTIQIDLNKIKKKINEEAFANESIITTESEEQKKIEKKLKKAKEKQEKQEKKDLLKNPRS